MSSCSELNRAYYVPVLGTALKTKQNPQLGGSPVWILLAAVDANAVPWLGQQLRIIGRIHLIRWRCLRHVYNRSRSIVHSICEWRSVVLDSFSTTRIELCEYAELCSCPIVSFTRVFDRASLFESPEESQIIFFRPRVSQSRIGSIQTREVRTA
jgi:hypothetical protein